MPKTRWMALVIVLCFAAAAPAAETYPDRIELSRSMAVALALRQNPDLQVSILNAGMARTELARSRAYYDPLLTSSVSRSVSSAAGDPFFRTRSTTASVGLTQYLPTGGSISLTPQTGYTTAEFDEFEPTTDWQSSLGVNLFQPLLRNAGREVTEVGIALAANAMDDTLEQFRFSIIDTVYSVITNYNRLYTLRRVLESRQEALDSAQQFLDEIRQKPAAALQGVEVANAEYAIAQRRRDLVEADRNVRDQEASLHYLTGMESRPRIIPLDPPSRVEPPETEAQAIEAAFEHRPDLKQLETSLETSLLLQRVAERQALPDLSLTAGAGLTGIGENFGDSGSQVSSDPGTFWSLGLFFSMPIGNNALKSDRLRSRIRTEQVQRQIRALKWRIRNEIKSDMRSLISARLQMRTADQSLQYAEQRLEEYRKNRRQGTATVQEVLDAERDRNAARNTQMDAIESFAFSVAKLWRDTGMLLERHRIYFDTARLEEVPQESPGLSELPPAAQAVAEAGEFSLLVGEYTDEVKLAQAGKLLARAGLEPQVKKGPGRQKHFIRLHRGDYPGQGAALGERDRLRRLGVDSFLLRRKEGGYAVYAGSYGNPDAAAGEQKRLAARGIEVDLATVTLSEPSFVLKAGRFPSREEAARMGLELEKLGLQPIVVEADRPEN